MDSVFYFVDRNYRRNVALDHVLGYPVPFIDSSRVRIELDSVYFIDDPTPDTSLYWTNGSLSHNDLLDQYVSVNYPDRTRALNIHLTHLRPGITVDYGGYAQHGSIETFYKTTPDMSGSAIHDWWLSTHWTHEIGHTFDLKHTYDVSEQTCNTSNIDFLWDLFDTTVVCTTPPCVGGVCLIPINTCNNILAGADANNTTALQMGIMNRSISMGNFWSQQSGAPDHMTGYGPAPFNVSTDETWDFPMKMYQDLVVRPGATLTLTCEVQFVPGAKLIVEPGARLIIDGALLTNEAYHRTFWQGIEVHGTTGQHQYPATQPDHQGLVELRNGAVIEHAREGVRLWEPGNYSSTGGVLIAQDATFRNCRRAVEGMKYEGFAAHDPSIRLPNRTRFNRVHFVVDNDYRGGTDFDTHVSLWGMEGVNFVECTWENLQSTMTESPDHVHGITSHESSFRVLPGCSSLQQLGSPCPPADVLPSVFRNLDHAIHATNGSGQSFSVDRAAFENNVIGVYTNSVHGFSVTRNTFVLGERAVTLVGPVDEALEDYHRGVFSHESHGFIIEDNALSMASNPQAGAEGIVVGYNRDFNDVVRRNTASGLEVGFVGEGICSDVQNGGLGFIGLQHECNTNVSNGVNHWDRKVLTDDDFQLLHTMRLNQGTGSTPARNQFDQETGTLDESDFKRTSENGVLMYHYGGLGDVEPLDNTPTWVETAFASNDPPGCPARSYPVGRLTGVQKALLDDSLEDGKLAYGNLRYAYNALLDGGSTDAVVAEISSAWSGDAWDLRDYLLGLSPFLTVESLQEMIQENKLPQAMALEVCLANPEATAQEGFTDWLLYEADHPMPLYMVEQIMASWQEESTLRAVMEGEMADHHRAMSAAAVELIADLRADTLRMQMDSILLHIQQLPTWSARLDEATLHMEQGQFAAARAVLDSLETQFTLKPAAEAERDRFHDLLNILEAVRNDDRTDAELDSAEVSDLIAFADGTYDRPAHWAQNILCFHYGLCRAPLTGGDPNRAPTIQNTQPRAPNEQSAWLRIHPNPASAWVAVDYYLGQEVVNATLLVRDLMGRELHRAAVKGGTGQIIWDTRQVPAGSYALVLLGSVEGPITETLIVQP
ncbi:MAG: hypothetical protein IPM68_16240 [Flavobacteriales bacterium]|nr:hypothetical protein [Flavobacteriales bacterium]